SGAARTAPPAGSRRVRGAGGVGVRARRGERGPVPPGAGAAAQRPGRRGRGEGEWPRAEAPGPPSAVARLRLPSDLPAERVALAAGQVLRPLDVLGVYGPGEYELLPPGLDAAHAAVALGGLARALPEAGALARLGLAAYPGDGAHA